jgi:hypothetical protein
MRRMGRPPLGTAARRLIAIRIDPQVLGAVRREAKRRGLGYQSLINDLLAKHVRRKRSASGVYLSALCAVCSPPATPLKGLERPYAEQELLNVRLTLQISKRIKARGLQRAPVKPLVRCAGDLPHTCTVPFGTSRRHRL